MNKESLKGFYVSSICAVVSFAVYLLTLAPTVQGFDSAELTVGAYALGFVHAPGYPLYILLGHGFIKLFPFGNIGLRLNLMSALFAGLTVLVLFWIERDSDQFVHAFPAVFLFAVAPLFWSQALRAEVYTLHTFLMVATLYLWKRAHRLNQGIWYILCFAILGLGMGNHSTTLLLWATILACLLWENARFRYLSILGIVLGVIVAGALYLYFPLRSAFALSVDYIRAYFDVDLGSPMGVWWLFSGKMFHQAFYLDGHSVISEIFRFAVLLWDNFLGIGVILGMWGWWRMNQSDELWNRLLSIYFATNAIGFVCYHVVDKEVMFIPALAVWSIWVAKGVQEIPAWWAERIQGVTTKTASVTVSVGLILLVGMGMVLNWQAVSLRDNRRTYDFSVELLKEVDPSASIISHWVTASVLDYLQIVEDRRPDVEVFNIDFYYLSLQDRHGTLENPAVQTEWFAWLEQKAEQQPVYAIEPLPAVPPGYTWVRQNLSWKLVADLAERRRLDSGCCSR